MRRLTPPLLLALLLAGCAAPAVTPGPAANVAAARAAAAQPPEPLAGMAFKTLAAENAQLAGGVGGGMIAAPMAAPMPTGVRAPAPAAMSPQSGGMAPPAPPPGLTSGNMNGGYGYGYGMGYMPFGGGEPMALVSLTQAEGPGSAGPYLGMMKAVVQPVVQAWAPDARLMNSNASTGADGLLSEATPAPSPLPAGCVPGWSGDETAWRLTYTSQSRAEALNFYVTKGKTLVVRARWAPIDLASVDVAVDNDVAIKALTTAIETEGFQAEEEKTGVDYFMGGNFTAQQACYGPMPTRPMPMASGAPELVGVERDEVVFDVPAGARWNVTLQVMLGKPVWELSYHMPQDAQAAPRPFDPSNPPADPGFYFNNSARGLIDARTGAVVRFSRPNKHYYPMPVGGMPPGKGAYPMPTPRPEAIRPASEAPTPVPTPSATTSAQPQ